MQLKMTLNFWSSCLHLPSDEVTGVCHHIWFTPCWHPTEGTFICLMFRETKKRDQFEGFYNSPGRKLLKGSELILKGVGRKNIYMEGIKTIKLAGLRERLDLIGNRKMYQELLPTCILYN